MERYWEFGSTPASRRTRITRTAPSRSCLYPTSKLQEQRWLRRDISTLPVRHFFYYSHWRSAGTLFFWSFVSFSHVQILFLSFVGAYQQSMVNVGAAKIMSSKVKARVINTNSWLLQKNSLSLECHNITSTVHLLAYELTLLRYHQLTCKLITDFSLPTFFWFGKS
jgi:hypothetical protein